MTQTGNAARQEVGRWADNRVENSHLPFRRRERAMLRFRQMKTLQKFAAVHATVHNHFNQDRHLTDRQIFKAKRRLGGRSASSFGDGVNLHFESACCSRMSKPISVDIPHQLGAAEARRRIDQGFGGIAEQMSGAAVANLSRTWDGDRMTFSIRALGQVITGQLLIMDDLVRIEVILPGVLNALTQAITGRIKRQGRLLLDRK